MHCCPLPRPANPPPHNWRQAVKDFNEDSRVRVLLIGLKSGTVSVFAPGLALCLRLRDREAAG